MALLCIWMPILKVKTLPKLCYVSVFYRHRHSMFVVDPSTSQPQVQSTLPRLISWSGFTVTKMIIARKKQFEDQCVFKS